MYPSIGTYILSLVCGFWLLIQVDQLVSNMMADFWVAFAAYGDPNGLPSANGYEGGTRPPGAPWWPRLMGELPSERATREMQVGR